MAPRPDERLCSPCNDKFGPMIRSIISRVMRERAKLRSIISRGRNPQNGSWAEDYYATYLHAHQEFLRIMATAQVGQALDPGVEEDSEAPEGALTSILRR